MRLDEILREMPDARYAGPLDRDVAAVVYDSRQVAPGALFVAVPGAHTDGHKYVESALSAGAVAAVVQTDRRDLVGHLPADRLIWVPRAQRALAEAAVAFYRHPGREIGVIGVTGTDGKTTTTALISDLLQRLGHPSGRLGTVDFKIADRVWPNDSRQSTLEAVEVQALLRRMADAGVRYAVVESTSHGLALDRVYGCEYDIGVFTNLTSDHLDFHGTVEQYFRDKARLFEMVGASVDKGIPKRAVLNADSPWFDELRRYCTYPILSYSRRAPADLMAIAPEVTASGIRMRVRWRGAVYLVALRLTGEFNVENALAALGAALALGLDPEPATTALGTLAGPPGRLQRIDAGQPFGVIVDYAHTPDSLAKVLGILRPLTEGRLTVVFGCAGERDKTKRPVMGEIAGKLADFVVLTDEDPRLEDRHAIIDEIAAGLEAAGRRLGTDYLKVPDRQEAIDVAIRRAGQGDLVLLAGKGHEGSIIYADGKRPWDECAAARAALAGRGFRQPA
ncbi:MAG TPA: UDP-N-acetylmuramoyl-L-alanyl-D-glutamate--2,6-diaminopimelate ligase [Dehalococcoidia bacterium]|nr:UDP-N-acetylmuramoyl-L-alanyl-D-glutamate--2,6-diaminopimelate ligase [Dehalococcoidia bacterium]